MEITASSLTWFLICTVPPATAAVAYVSKNMRLLRHTLFVFVTILLLVLVTTYLNKTRQEISKNVQHYNQVHFPSEQTFRALR